MKYQSLIIISYGAIGDFVMLLSFLKKVHEADQSVHTYVLTTRNEGLLKEMAAKYPFVKVVTLSSWGSLRLFFATLLQRTAFVIPPTFVDVPWFVRACAYAYTAPWGSVAGFTGRVRGPRYGVSVPFEKNTLFYEHLNQLGRKLGFPIEGLPVLSFREDTAPLAALGERYIVLAPFASNPGKTLPEERWVTLLRFLAAAYPALKIALVGAPGDRTGAERLIRAAGLPSLVSFCGAPFAQTVVLIGHAACFIGADSGLTHVAGVLQARSVVVGNRRTLTWLPTYNPRAVVLTEAKNCVCNGDKTGGDCNYRVNGVAYLRCMYDVSDERIEQAITEGLAHTT